MKKIKLFALALMAIFSLSAMAETVTMDCALSKGSTPAPSIGSPILNGGAFDGNGYKLGSDGNYIGWDISAAERTFTAVSFNGYINTTSTDKNWAFQFSTDGGATWSTEVTQSNDGTKSYHDIAVGVEIPSGANALRIVRRAGTSSYVASITLTLAPNCTAPTNPLEVKTNHPDQWFVGQGGSVVPDGGNGSTITMTLNGEAFDYEALWTPTVAGDYTFVATQEANGAYCAQEAELVINVASDDPVTTASIVGPSTAFIGQEVTLSIEADAAPSSAYWYDAVTYTSAGTGLTKTFTPTEAGEYKYYAHAFNSFNTDPAWAETEVFTVTVTKLCGELIKATHTGGKTATVEGVVGGTYDKNTADNSKFGSKGQYFGITLADGEKFQRTDVLNVHTTTAAGQGTIAIYADKDGNTLLYDTESMGVAGDNEIVLPAALDGLSTLYICRTEGNTWNGFVDYISVSRSCEESDNANIDKVWVKTGETEEQHYEPESDGVTYNLVVPASVDIAEVDVYFSLEHPLATADQTSPIHFIVPAAGDPAVSETIVVTAENDDTKNYTINVSKSAAASTEAHLSSLSVNGFTLDPVFDENTFAYTITKPFGADNPGTDAVVAEPADPTAHPHTEAVGANQLVVTVTAEDGVSQEVYTITINTAEAPKTLEHVLFANGFDAFIDNAARTVKAFYLAGEAAPEAVQITAGSGTAGAMTGNKIGVTGADMSYVEYTVTLEEVTPYTDAVAADAEAGVFDGTETWIKTGILESGNAAGFSDNYYVIRRQKKGSDAADDQRVFAGYVRAYLFVGNASELQLTIGSNKAVKYAVDGGEYTEDGDGTLNIALEEGNHLVEIVSNQQSGDGRISAPKLIERGSSTALDEAAGEVKARKIVRDGQIIIVRGDKEFNLVGAEL